MNKLVAFLYILVFSHSANFDINIFPKPTNSQTRYIIELPEKQNEQDYQVQIYMGKYMQTDTCNHIWIDGTMETKILNGWGYNYHVFTGGEQTSSTVVGCLDGKQINRFVTSQTQPLIRYNSKLPIIIYAPKEIKIKYHIWTKNQEVQFAIQK